jgi:hypothetical protein
MVDKFGSDQQQLANSGGSVVSQDDAVLINGDSDGETALLFGPAALREIQSGVANGDFAITPVDSEGNITADNALPYWTFTDVNSAGAITCAIVTDASAGSGNVLRWSVAASTVSGKSAKLTRFVPVSASRTRAFSFSGAVSITGATSTANITFSHSIQFYKQDQATTTGSLTTYGPFAWSLLTGTRSTTNTVSAPSDAAFALVTITIATTATSPASASTIDVTEVQMIRGTEITLFSEATTPATYAPAIMYQSNGNLNIYPDNGNGKVRVSLDLVTFGSLGMDGAIYGSSDLTGIRIVRVGTNNRLWAHSSPAADVAASTATTVSGVLVTKPTAGQPTTNINGTGTTDAFADALRNGGIAVDTANNRGYFYSNGWKYANLTTPSDSRLKEQITEISGALDTLRQLMPVAFKWKAPEAHGRTDAVADDGTRLGFIADQVATTDLAHWVETLGVDDREAHLVDTTEVLAVNIPQNEMEALVVQALLDIDARLKALEGA